MNGFVLIDKPIGPTSFDMVKQVRRLYNEKKVGHVGTLDPLASGLLVIALGTATRLLPFLPHEPKSYTFTVRFGESTDTLDSEGKIVAHGGHMPSHEEIQKGIAQLTGTIQQIPPRFSAIKVNGKRAYDLARAGVDFELAPRTVTIFSFVTDAIDPVEQCATFSISCSAGTYVRSLAFSIAQLCNTLAHIKTLRRTAVGIFNIKDSFSLEKRTDSAIVEPTSAFEIFGNNNAIITTSLELNELKHGRSILYPVAKRIKSTTEKMNESKYFFAFDDNNNLVAVLNKSETEPDKLFPIRVFVAV